MIVAPKFANFLAIIRPIPDPPPVIRIFSPSTDFENLFGKRFRPALYIAYSNAAGGAGFARWKRDASEGLEILILATNNLLNSNVGELENN